MPVGSNFNLQTGQLERIPQTFPLSYKRFSDTRLKPELKNSRVINLKIQSQVQAALQAGQPVVALESTLITHGFPAPDNLTVAQAMEAVVLEQGAIPATIALLSGEIHVGLSAEELIYLSQASDVRKCSRRDLPIACARREDGATTVAATMLVAHWAGIRLFATGGIGGVHRGFAADESADLMELGRTPVTVVCAGAKAILDLPLTLEKLESYGVPIIGYQTDELPAFYSRSSSLPIDARVERPEEIADIIIARDTLKLETGILVTNPIPSEYEWPHQSAQRVINQAIADAETGEISGKSLTPYLLDRVNTLSGVSHKSKRANIALLLNNAALAGKIAVALSQKS